MSVRADAAERLERVFGLVAARAAEGRITYGELAGQLGVSARGTGPYLNPLLRWCRLNGLPPLPVIVVNKASGRPSTGNYEPSTIAAETRRVRAHDWSAVLPPTRHQLASLRRAPDFAAR